jgi:hypothetical protein
VTAANLLASERFWPYRVTLAKRDLASPLPVGSVGVLVRVEPGGRARIDFGRDGVHTLPVAITDLVEQANRVRTGELTKLAPNLAAAIGPRLSGAALGTLRLPLTAASEQRGFLTVFADPKSPAFDEIARGLAPLQQHPGVMTVLFPLTLVDESRFGERLSALGWRVPHVYDYLVPGYAEALVPSELAPPVVSLQTAEGRLLLQAPWRPALVAELRTALEREFPAPLPPALAGAAPAASAQ